MRTKPYAPVVTQAAGNRFLMVSAATSFRQWDPTRSATEDADPACRPVELSGWGVARLWTRCRSAAAAARGSAADSGSAAVPLPLQLRLVSSPKEETSREESTKVATLLERDPARSAGTQRPGPNTPTAGTR